MSESARILIVDDIEENIELLTRLLERAGHRISSTTDPQEAVAMMLDVSPDLIVLDLEMPEMTGLEVMASIHEVVGSEESPPVLVLTGTANTEAEWMCLASGAGDFVRKPFRSGELLLRVKNLIEAGAARRRFVAPAPSIVAGAAAEGDSSSAAQVRKVAHDLNNLLTQICGYADLLQLGTRGDATSSADAAEVQRAARAASDLTAQLLAFGLPKSGVR